MRRCCVAYRWIFTAADRNGKAGAVWRHVIGSDVVERLVTRPLEEDVFQLVNASGGYDLRKSFHMWDLCVEQGCHLPGCPAMHSFDFCEVKAL